MDRDEVFEAIQRYAVEVPQRSRWYGVYYAVVEDNADPLKLGRLKIRPPQLYSSDPDGRIELGTEDLYWANPSAATGGGKGFGFYSIPPVGSTVTCAFVDGDLAYPLWIGTTWGAPGTVAETLVADYDEAAPYGLPGDLSWSPTRQSSWVTPGGAKLLFDDNISTAATYRRMQLELTPRVTLAGVTAAAGVRVVGTLSGARGTSLGAGVFYDVRGKFIAGEPLVGLDGLPQGAVTTVEEDPNYRLRFIESKTVVEANMALVPPKGLLELADPDGRSLTFDGVADSVVLGDGDDLRLMLSSLDKQLTISAGTNLNLTLDGLTFTATLTADSDLKLRLSRTSDKFEIIAAPFGTDPMALPASNYVEHTHMLNMANPLNTALVLPMIGLHVVVTGPGTFPVLGVGIVSGITPNMETAGENYLVP